MQKNDRGAVGRTGFGIYDVQRTGVDLFQRGDQAGTNTSFASLKQIDASLLNVGYAEAGPANGPVVILLHGWPYDIHDVAPLLASAGGYRVIVPYVRGCWMS